MPPPAEWDEAADVVVMGSGSAALAAALTASVCSARVLVLEKASVLGGTSAMSGAGTWIPANHHMLAAGHHDSPNEALTYIRATAPEGWEEQELPRWRAFVENAPRMLRFLEDHTPLRFRLIHHPDIFADAPGGREMGRMLVPSLLRLAAAGPWRRRIRRSTKPQIFDYDEIMTGDAMVHPVRTILRLSPKLLRRLITGQVGMGNALIVGLVRGCLDHGCDIRADASVIGLFMDHDRIAGVQARIAGHDRRIHARKGVVIASGGFEWDDAMLQQHFFPSEIVLRGSPRTNQGDGHKMADAAGAALGRMDQANINPVVLTRYERQRHAMPFGFADYAAHCIIVNRHAQRFVSEGDRNLGMVLTRRDPRTGEPLHLPAWRIFDSRYAKNHRFFMRLHDRPPPDHLRRADTLAKLAAQIGLDPSALERTVERFNGFVRNGSDADFRRGETAFEASHGNHGPSGNPQLGTLEQPPFYATPYYVGILGTKGGPRTNEHGQVLRADGSRIGGLYCAGVAMANPFGTKNIGAGTTIGPNMTWGYICANAVLRENA